MWSIWFEGNYAVKLTPAFKPVYLHKREMQKPFKRLYWSRTSTTGLKAGVKSSNQKESAERLIQIFDQVIGIFETD
jgi:hypothetical protein